MTQVLVDDLQNVVGSVTWDGYVGSPMEDITLWESTRISNEFIAALQDIFSLDDDARYEVSEFLRADRYI